MKSRFLIIVESAESAGMGGSGGRRKNVTTCEGVENLNITWEAVDVPMLLERDLEKWLRIFFLFGCCFFLWGHVFVGWAVFESHVSLVVALSGEPRVSTWWCEFAFLAAEIDLPQGKSSFWRKALGDFWNVIWENWKLVFCLSNVKSQLFKLSVEIRVVLNIRRSNLEN